MKKLTVFVLCSLMSGMTLAVDASSLISIIPCQSNPTTVQVPNSGTTTVRYTVTNHMPGSHTLAMTSIPAVTQVTTAGYCGNPFTLSTNQSCILNLSISGPALAATSSQHINGGPIITDVNSGDSFVSQLSPMNELHTTLGSAGTGILSLSVSNLALYASSTGIPRTITITAAGGSVGTVSYSLSRLPGIVVSPSPGSATTSTTGICGVMTAGQTCVLTIDPTHAIPSGAAAVAASGTLTVSSDTAGINPQTATISALTYGNLYEGGYVFNIVDQTSSTAASITGTVAAKQDVTSPSKNYPWGGFGLIPGASSLTDGAGNTRAIIAVQGTGNWSGAEVCDGYQTDANGAVCASNCTYTDWYLPALCEMGTNANGKGYSNCSTSTSNNMDNELAQNESISNSPYGLIKGYESYWTSTQNSSMLAWNELFGSANTSSQGNGYSAMVGPIRCVRAF